jgi:hypothetical protein
MGIVAFPFFLLLNTAAQGFVILGLATWMLPTFGWLAIAVYVIACVVITLAAAALLPDRSQADLAEAPVLEPAGRAAGG